MTQQLEADLGESENELSSSGESPPKKMNGKQDRSQKPDTSGGVKIKLRDTDNPEGVISSEDLKQELLQLSDMITGFPEGTRFKWATFYMTPIDPDGNKIQLEGPKNKLITPQRTDATGPKI